MQEILQKVPKILVLKSSSEQIFSLKLPLGAPDTYENTFTSTVKTKLLNSC